MGVELDGAGLGIDGGVRLERRARAGDQLAVGPRSLPLRRRRPRPSSPARRGRTPRRRRSRGRRRRPRATCEAMSSTRSRRLLGRVADGVAADERAARGERARADGRRVGVRVVHRHPVVGHAERVGDDLGVHRPGALADVDRAGEDVDAPVRLELDPGLARVAVLVHAGGVLDRGETRGRVCLASQASSPFVCCCAASQVLGKQVACARRVRHRRVLRRRARRRLPRRSPGRPARSRDP